ncbi:MAG: TonB-dependent receptor [Nevskiaceae bacterium]|jgi:outer membrane receptor protein involved in Fe transport|nr:TonB-dependent receptor [Nevskiaceae bacterium]
MKADWKLKHPVSTTALGALLLAGAGGVAWSADAAAPNPEAQAEEPEGLGEVVVVGSRIRRTTFDSPAPLVVITRDDVNSAGFSSITEALQSTGVTNGGAQINNAFGGYVTDGGPGANTLSMRNLGAGRTLVLINGRRVAPSGTRGAVGSADLNVLPNAIVNRVEVLRDGASSVYGSDAIAGVVNVVTDTNIEGLTFEGRYTAPQGIGGDETRLSVVGGLSGDRWRFSASAEYYQRQDLTLADRAWTRCNTDQFSDPETGEVLDFIDPLTGEPKCYPITGTGSNGVTINTIGTQALTGVGAAGSVGTSFNRWRPNSAITTGLVGFEGVGGGTNNINVRDTFEPRMLNESLISPAKVTTFFAQGSYDLQTLGDAQLYSEVLANRRDSSQVNYRQLSMDYRLGSPLIPDNLADSNFGPDQGTSDGERVGVRAFVGFGNDHSQQRVDFIKATIGLRGNVTPLTGWRYDGLIAYADSDATYDVQSFLTDRVTYASDVVAAPTGTDAQLVRDGLTCRINIDSPAERCIPFPPLSSQTVGGVLPQDFKDYIFRPVHGSTRYKETLANLTFDGPLFTLPAGEMQGVLGLEYRRQQMNDSPDPNSVAGNLYNLTVSAPTRGKDNVKEIYTEIEIPLLRDKLLADNLTLNGSLRWTDYDSYGDDMTYKIAAMYAPVDWLSFRATLGTSFRAPALFEQFQGATSGFLSAQGDPCYEYGTLPASTLTANCATQISDPEFRQTQSIRVNSEGGAGSGLAAETSDNLTVGVIVQHDIGSLGRLSLALDYFDIKIKNGVSQVGAASILDLCYVDPTFDPNEGFCRLVTRDPTTLALSVSDAYTNIATQVTTGFDYSLRWERQVGPGNLRFNANATQFRKQDFQLFPDDPVIEWNGTINYPEWSGTFDLAYQMDKWRFNYVVDWVGKMNSYEYLEEIESESIYDFKTSDYFVHAISARYTSDENWEITAGIRNVWNAKIPTISSLVYNRVGNAPLYSEYDYVGRRAFVTVTKKF